MLEKSAGNIRHPEYTKWLIKNKKGLDLDAHDIDYNDKDASIFLSSKINNWCDLLRIVDKYSDTYFQDDEGWHLYLFSL